MVVDHDHGATLAQAAEAARLAHAYGGEPRQRFGPDGTVDVVVMQRGRMMLYRIDADGSSYLSEAHPPVRRHVWGRRILIMAGVVFVAAFVVPFLVVGVASALGFGPIDLDRANGWSEFVGTATGGGGVGAVVLFFIGVFYGGNLTVYDGFKAANWDTVAWHEIPDVTGPAPQTRAQLEVSQWLAAKHDREAFVRGLPDGTAELVAASDGRVFRYMIGRAGDVRLVARSDARARHYIGLGFLVLAALALVSIFAAAFAGLSDSDLILWLFGATFLSMLIGFALTADHRAAQLARPSEDWLAIRLPKPSD